MASSRLVILPYKLGSLSAKLLALGLSTSLGRKVRRVKPLGRYRPKVRSVILNYGSNTSPTWLTPVNRVLNKPAACALAGNKLRAFERFTQHNVRSVDWTTDRNVAATWITENHATVICRTLLNSHSGRGIVLATTVEQLVRAPLYTKYKKKKKEFRVHVFNGQVIDLAEKRKRNRAERPEAFDGFIRNHANGWVFCRDGIVLPDDVRGLAVRACAALDLDFGAVDIIWNERDSASYVLEVNTAPGLEGTTLENYKRAVLSWMNTI